MDTKKTLRLILILILSIYGITKITLSTGKFTSQPVLKPFIAYAEDDDEKSEAQKQAEEKAREAAKQQAEKEREAEKKEGEREKKEEREREEENKVVEEFQGNYEEKVVTITKTVYVPIESERIIEYVEPEKKITYRTVIDAGYDVDTDKDGLVDAIDPNPLVHEKNFFTDTDNDSMADAFDKWAGEDDFYFLEDSDANLNGILDSYE